MSVWIILIICASCLLLIGITKHNKSQTLETFLFASELCDMDRLKRLIKKNPGFVYVHGKEGKTALHWAAEKGRKDVAEFLLKEHADVTAKSEWNWTPLHEVAKFHYLHVLAEVHKQVAELLLVYNADVQAKNCEGMTPLHVAASNGSKYIVELLITKNADINAEDNGGHSPLHLAMWGGVDEIVNVLLEKGAKFNIKDNVGDTPLHFAAHWGCIDAVKMLLRKGSDVNAKNNLGQTPLHNAILGNGNRCFV